MRPALVDGRLLQNLHTISRRSTSLKNGDNYVRCVLVAIAFFVLYQVLVPTPSHEDAQVGEKLLYSG